MTEIEGQLTVEVSLSIALMYFMAGLDRSTPFPHTSRALHLEHKILPSALDRNVLKSAIGVATLNAVSQIILESEVPPEFSIVRDTDGFDLLKILPHETVSMVGAFGPYIRRLKMMGNPQTLRPGEMKFLRPESEMGAALERSDAAIVTGTAIVNHSIDSILTHMCSVKRSGIIGPTASMIPNVFFQRGIGVMAGVRISNPRKMTGILRQGGSAYHLLRERCEKIAFIKETPHSRLGKIGGSLSKLEEGGNSKRTSAQVRDRRGCHRA